MILVDSSAWIEYLRDTGSAACEAVDTGIRDGGLAVCDPIRLEVLAGARDDLHLDHLQRMLSRADRLEAWSGDHDFAATLYRSCRRRGITVRRLLDCLIAAIAIREDVPLLHADRDFDVLARHTPLRTVS